MVFVDCSVSRSALLLNLVIEVGIGATAGAGANSGADAGKWSLKNLFTRKQVQAQISTEASVAT